MHSPFLILTADPSRSTLIFADQLAGLTDNEVIIISDRQPGEYPRVAKCLYIDDSLAFKNGFFNSSPLIPKIPIAWDKALYCLIENKIEFDYVWIMEDDVLFISTMVCLELLSKYINSTSDLILPNFFRRTQLPSWPNWCWFAGAESFQIEHQAGGFMPLCRLSRQMIYVAGDFMHEHGSLDFVEVMFPSLAIRHGLKVEIMDFISERRFRWAPAISKWELMQRWGDNLQTGIFHPVKSEKVRSGASVKPSRWYIAVLTIASPALETALFCQRKVLPYTKKQTRRLLSEGMSRVKNLWPRASN